MLFDEKKRIRMLIFVLVTSLKSICYFIKFGDEFDILFMKLLNLILSEPIFQTTDSLNCNLFLYVKLKAERQKEE